MTEKENKKKLKQELRDDYKQKFEGLKVEQENEVDKFKKNIQDLESENDNWKSSGKATRNYMTRRTK